MQKNKDKIFQKILETGLKLARNLGYECDVSFSELKTYLEAPTYTQDKITLKEIAETDYLCLHEVIEISCLKKKGIRITRDVFKHGYLTTYECHLEAMKVELDLAYERRDKNWILRRLNDLKSYLEDPYLPQFLRKKIEEMIKDVHAKLKRIQAKVSS